MEYNEVEGQVELVEAVERVPTIGNEVVIDNNQLWQPIVPEAEAAGYNYAEPAEWQNDQDVQEIAMNPLGQPLDPNVQMNQPVPPPQNIPAEEDPVPWNPNERDHNFAQQQQQQPEDLPVAEVDIAEIEAVPDPPIVVIDDDSDDTQNQDVDEEIEMAKKKLKLDIKTKEDKAAEEDEDNDTGRLCPICMDYWSNSGDHRLCSLRCGHLFGYSCVHKWLTVACTSGNRRCPQCNKKATQKDIRVIYATSVSVIDTVEIDMLKKQLLEVNAEKNRIELELSNSQLRQRSYLDQIANLQKRIVELERQKSDMSIRINESMSSVAKKFHLDHTVDICKEGGCRVLAYNPWYGCLAVSQLSRSALFTGYGVKKILTDKFQAMPLFMLHTQQIRDIAFHPVQQSLLLSISFDRTAKLMDVQNNVTVHGYPIDSQGWSCCWSGDNPNIFHAGTQKGSIVQFDIRQTSGAVDTIESPGDRSPVVSLSTVPPNSSTGLIRGGFIATRLNTCFAYEPWNNVYVPKQMFLEGPFMSIRYDEKNHHALVSSRPNSRQPQSRHLVLSLEAGNENSVVCNIVHTFHAGNSQKLMSRPCHVNLQDDTLVAAHQENTRSIPLWSIGTGKQLHSIQAHDPALDLVSFATNDKTFLASLSEKKLRLYNYD
ncbi:E3 ubiquitin-protein ligase RFWD3 [Microplitis demolitor]|uniref:E3 ubiquitin-protein ligase RFWD3 n=1 Tax=Microplitis demolitor TaxID=69319 RepID=UPI0004CDC012|nr:E3 ubiquitin-protein ligase RFWD3 [Microplitis demolitor]